jgi:hypothetical protein
LSGLFSVHPGKQNKNSAGSWNLEIRQINSFQMLIFHPTKWKQNYFIPLQPHFKKFREIKKFEVTCKYLNKTTHMTIKNNGNSCKQKILK